MTRKYSLVIEGDPGSYSAAAAAIHVYWETLREIEVELPA